MLNEIINNKNLMCDPYLDENLCIKRLIDEYNKYGKLIVAYDFDGTVYDFHNKGYNFNQLIDLLRTCHQIGFYLICFTCSEEDRYNDIKEYLIKNDIPFDSINENAPFTPFKTNKVYYNILLDDRAGLCSAVAQLQSAIFYMKYLRGGIQNNI